MSVDKQIQPTDTAWYTHTHSSWLNTQLCTVRTTCHASRRYVMLPLTSVHMRSAVMFWCLNTLTLWRLFVFHAVKMSVVVLNTEVLRSEQWDRTTCLTELRRDCHSSVTRYKISNRNETLSPSQCPSGLRRGSRAARLLGLRVRIPPGVWKSVSCKCCVLSGRSLCDGPIPRPEESYRLWCVIVCDLETPRIRRPWSALGCCARKKKWNTWI